MFRESLFSQAEIKKKYNGVSDILVFKLLSLIILNKKTHYSSQNKSIFLRLRKLTEINHGFQPWWLILRVSCNKFVGN